MSPVPSASPREELAGRALDYVEAAATAAAPPPAPPGEVLPFVDTANLAAMAMVAGTVPASLAARLRADAMACCADRRAGMKEPAHRAGGRRLRRLPAFAAGLAAGVLVGFGLWSVPSRPADPATERAQLVADGNRAVSWNRGPSALGGDFRGDVVWSDRLQAGYLHFTGLRPLDPEHQYQLWIVDARRTGAPVDGGLFGVPAGAAEFVVPIHAKLPVGRAATFVVTVEQRGGVVVSGQEQVVAVANG